MGIGLLTSFLTNFDLKRCISRDFYLSFRTWFLSSSFLFCFENQLTPFECNSKQTAKKKKFKLSVQTSNQSHILKNDSILISNILNMSIINANTNLIQITLYFFELLERNYICFFSFLFIGQCTDSIWQCGAGKWQPIYNRVWEYRNLNAKIETGLQFLFLKI